MIGHRVLPLLNSFIAVALWIGLAAWLTPDLRRARHGDRGRRRRPSPRPMPRPSSSGSATASRPFDRKLFQGLALALAGVALMALGEWLLDGPARFAARCALWAVTSWLTLRYGLTRDDREALGGLSRRLRLV